MLLIIEALLLILAALGQDHSAAAVEGQIYQLDMAPNSVDDQYDGCKDEMAKLVKTELLKNELKKSPDFKTAWEKGEKFAKSQNDDLTKNHSIAIYVYSDALVYKPFNNDTRHDKNQYKHMKYKWYSLHFLLTNAIQILKKTQNQCYTTYRGTNLFYKNVLNKEVRFGSFASSSLDRKVARGFGNVSCFEINTCKGANVTEYSKLPHEKEVLIPPYEKFKVTAVKTRGEQKDPWCETVFYLNSTETRSDLNCALFKKPSKTKTKSYVLNNVL
ncbi:NAD(P)(+)--arginine ADP-ribosyltransferase 2-like [Rhinichthys klamathensis goyatoka]|uniref:NAD(P)(+)--arginine ADP-ribosyltransferase 2-like n=1 Tax=Rhinichthys klamathensis goyatoka TaxID=3034132 RepID=UPI0024B5DC43|nr:NAD(P)(+)--arginine ADP-ribosyltransferase 2-like [Rhinichthys klamathensis goyatoka]